MKEAQEIRSIEVLGSARWITLAEACAYSCKSENTIKALLKSGNIYGSKAGTGTWTIDRVSIDQLFNQERDERRLELARRLKPHRRALCEVKTVGVR